jgi:predicted N-acyltransferase
MTVFIGQDDTEPPFKDTLKRAGTAVNLTTASALHFHMETPDGSLITSTTASITTASAGEVEYQWSASDTATASTYYAEWEVDWGTETETFPNTDEKIAVKVASQIA